MSSLDWRLEEIRKRNKERFGPAGIKCTDVPRLLAALEKAIDFIDDSHEWSEDTFKTLQKQTLEDIQEALSGEQYENRT